MHIKEKLFSNVIFVGAIELIIATAAVALMNYILDLPFFAPVVNSLPDLEDLFISITFIIPSAVTILLMWFINKDLLKIFTSGTPKRRIASLTKGLIGGFLLNSLVSILAGVSGSVSYSLHRFSILIIILLPVQFVICLYEEVLLRAYVPGCLEKNHSWDAVAFVIGMLFIFHHTSNMQLFGFSPIFCLNVFVVGIILYLLVRCEGNFWICCGFHTGWNYTQQYLFGIPCSGVCYDVSLLHGTSDKDTFFFNSTYGHEGSMCTLLLNICLLLVLFYWNKKSNGSFYKDICNGK